MLSICYFLNFKAQVAFSKLTLAKDDLIDSLWLKSNSSTSQWASPCQGGHGTKELLASVFLYFPPASGGSAEPGWCPRPGWQTWLLEHWEAPALACPILWSVLLLTSEEPSPSWSVLADIDMYSWPCIFMAPETAARHKVPEQVYKALNMV